MSQRFGEKLKELRAQTNLTQTDLAKRLGFLSRAHLANLEEGRDVPSLVIAVQIAEHLGVTIDSLLRDDRELEVWSPSITPLSSTLQVAFSFGARLRALRRARNIKQWELASDLCLASRAHLSDLETGRRLPSIALVMKIADYFDVTMDTLLRSDTPAEHQHPREATQ